MPGFSNVIIGPNDLNALAPSYSACTAPLTFANGLRKATQGTALNTAQRFLHPYSICDGLTYSVSANLTMTCSTPSASIFDTLGNSYQMVVNVTGARLYTCLRTGATLMSTVSGLSTAANALVGQRFYPYTLLGSRPGVYTVNTAPCLDAGGVEFTLNPPAPINGLPPGTGTQFAATTVYFTAPETIAVLTEGNYVNLPLLTYRQQSFTLLSS